MRVRLRTKRMAQAGTAPSKNDCSRAGLPSTPGRLEVVRKGPPGYCITAQAAPLQCRGRSMQDEGDRAREQRDWRKARKRYDQHLMLCLPIHVCVSSVSEPPDAQQLSQLRVPVGDGRKPGAICLFTFCWPMNLLPSRCIPYPTKSEQCSREFPKQGKR